MAVDLSKLGEEPLPTEGIVIPFSAETRRFLDWLQSLIDRDDCTYARDTLEGIYQSVNKSGLVSDAQRAAVENIHLGALKRKDSDEDDLANRAEIRRHATRRWEGFGR